MKETLVTITHALKMDDHLDNAKGSDGCTQSHHKKLKMFGSGNNQPTQSKS